MYPLSVVALTLALIAILERTAGLIVFGYYYWKKSTNARTRSLVLLIIYWYSLSIVNLSSFSSAYSSERAHREDAEEKVDPVPCWLRQVQIYLVPDASVAPLSFCFFLYMVYMRNKRLLDANLLGTSSSESMEEYQRMENRLDRLKYWAKFGPIRIPAPGVLIQERYIWIASFFVHLISVIVNGTLGAIFPDNCYSDAVSYSYYFQFVYSIGLVILCICLLWKVRDAHFMKAELQIFGILVLLIAAPALILTSLSNAIAPFGSIIFILFWIISDFLLIHWRWITCFRASKLPPPEEPAKIETMADWLRNFEHEDVLREFLLQTHDIQNVRLMYLMWCALDKYTAIEDEEKRALTAYFLIGKYLDPNAFEYIHGLPVKIINPLLEKRKELQEVSEGNSSKLTEEHVPLTAPVDLFKKLVKHLDKVLKQELIPRFAQSPQFKKLQTRMLLVNNPTV